MSRKAKDLTIFEETKKYAFVRKYVFLAFVIIAIVAGLAVGYVAWSESGTPDGTIATTYGWITFVLLILGIVAGLTNLTSKNVTPFLVAAIALSLIRGEAFQNPLNMVHPLLGFWARYIINFIVAFVAPAAIILSIKAIFALARGK
mgnify:CR=1 FL=1